MVERAKTEILNLFGNAGQVQRFVFFNFVYDRLSFLQYVEVFDLWSFLVEIQASFG